MATTPKPPAAPPPAEVSIDHPVVKTEVDENAKKKEELSKKVGEILKANGGESNIPPSSEYWDLMNQLRALK